MARIALHTHGCKLNQAETESLARQLWAEGYQVVSPTQPAHAYLLNTCTVTATADAKARSYLRRASRMHPDALIAATGCYAQRRPGEIARLPGVGLVVGQEARPHLSGLLRERGLRPDGEASRPPLRTRALVKIQDGCSMGCRYCIVPSVRGKGRSRAPSEVVAEVAQREAEGYREVVLTGTHIGSYRWDGMDLAGLLGRVLAATAVPRLRLTSLQPADLTPHLLSLWRSSGEGRLCSHLHLPLQSGSGPVLQGMGRPYSPSTFRRAVDLAREMVPGMAITTDVMVGFPGEGEAEFDEGLRFCREVGFARLHVFPYSPRPGTPAASVPQVDYHTVARRTRRLLSEAAATSRRFAHSQVGKMAAVLWEGETAPGVWSGLAPGYVRAFARSPQPLAGVIAPARLESPAPGGLWARLL
jgi:threonylcarbamoyladenosine tRNA methylthiotransferase MtaB